MKVELTLDEVFVLLQVLPIANQRLETFGGTPKTLKQKKVFTKNVNEYKEHLTNVFSKIDTAYGAYIESEEYLNSL